MDAPRAEHTTVEQAAADFAAEITYWREVRALSKKQLAVRMSFDPSYVSKIEGGRVRPTEEFARLAEEILNAGKAIWNHYTVYESAHARTKTHPMAGSHRVEQLPSASALVVEHDEARLDYDGSRYHLRMRRKIANVGCEPISRYLVRISVDRYPGDPDRSNVHYRSHPLTWAELALQASCRGEPMRWTVKHDRDAFKEVWVAFENDDGRFPLYPGEDTWFEYSYTVGDDKWGRWFQRAVRLPTHRLAVDLAFPADLDPVVWGTETSMTSEAIPLRTAAARCDHGARRVFSWSTESPALHARYRLEWRFKARPQSGDAKETTLGD